MRPGGRNPQLSRRLFLAPETARITASHAAEDHERLEIVAVRTRVVAVGGPEIDLIVADAQIGIARREAARDGTIPGLAHRYHGADIYRVAGGLVVRGAHVQSHGFDGFSEPMPGRKKGLVGPRPGRGETDVDP